MSRSQPFAPHRPEHRLDVPTAIERIRARDPALRAFLLTRLDEARREHEARLNETPRSPLHGLPFSLKDMWEIAGLPTTAGSHRFRDRIATTNAPVYEAFRDAGAVLMGKTSLSDLAIIPESSNYFVGHTRNPFDRERTAGGSSGGAAVAVAEGMSAFDWGSDFGGSIRLPAAYCGTYGMRLSTEAWPIEGMFPMLPASLAWMNGQGPLTDSIERMRDVLAVAAPRLRKGRTVRFEPRGAMVYAPDRASAGEWPEFEHDVRPALRAALGDVSTEHGLPPPRRASVLAPAVVASHFDDMMEVDDSLSVAQGVRAVASAIAFRGRFGDKRFHPHTAAMLALIALGRVTIFRDREKAVAGAARFRDAVQRLWHQGWVLAMPTVTFPAPKHGGSLRNTQIMTFSMIGNISDATTLAIPFGTFRNGLPRSVQIWGPPGSEMALLDVAERMKT